jgi:hypothetical protein
VKSLFKLAAVLLWPAAFCMLLYAIWGDQPWRWGITALVTGLCALGATFAYEDMKEPTPRAVPEDNSHKHHLY